MATNDSQPRSLSALEQMVLARATQYKENRTAALPQATVAGQKRKADSSLHTQQLPIPASLQHLPTPGRLPSSARSAANDRPVNFEPIVQDQDAEKYWAIIQTLADLSLGSKLYKQNLFDLMMLPTFKKSCLNPDGLPGVLVEALRMKGASGATIRAIHAHYPSAYELVWLYMKADQAERVGCLAAFLTDFENTIQSMKPRGANMSAQVGREI